jgi:hypothetical protein
LLEGCRELFLDYGLAGNISIETTFATTTYSISLDIDPEDEEEELESSEETKAELIEAKKSNSAFSLTMASLKSKIKSCRRRAQTYKNRKYRKGLTIGQGFGMASPMIAVASISITIEMTVESLLGINKEIEGADDEGVEDGDGDSDDEVGGAKYWNELNASFSTYCFYITAFSMLHAVYCVIAPYCSDHTAPYEAVLSNRMKQY